MRNINKFILAILLVGATFALAQAEAKRTLPINIGCLKTGAESAKVTVKFQKPATDVTITVVGKGSLQLEKTVKQFSSVAEDGELTFDTAFATNGGRGGVTVHVKANFGNGPNYEVKSFNLVKASTVNQKSSTRPRVIVAPANTTVKP